MAKFSARKAVARSSQRAPIRTTGKRTRTFEGALAFERDAKSDLFLLAVTNMVGEDTFYESGSTRDDRFVRLVHAVTQEDPEWVARFLPWLRQTANVRSAPIVGAAEYVRAGGPNGRAVVKSVLQRPDEPAEILGYWMANYGRSLPMPLKRGVADAVTERLYTERNSLRYDGNEQGIRFGDVIELVHPRPKDQAQSKLFRYLLDKRHKHVTPVSTAGLRTIEADQHLLRLPEDQRRAVLRSPIYEVAGWSWERLSGWLPGGMDAQAWEAVIPTMGYMALLRNLRNFEQANISKQMLDAVRLRLSNGDEVRRSRQFPYRFLSAYKAVESLTFAREIEEALDLSCENIPSFSGRTLVLVDVSASMDASVSKHTQIARYEVGALFAAALALKGDGVDLGCFATGSQLLDISSARSVLRLIERVIEVRRSQRLDHGTLIWNAINRHYNGHNRIVIFTDGQSQDSGGFHGPQPFIHTFNLAGYAPSHTEVGKDKSFEYGGFTDATFRLMNILETVGHGTWPF